MRQKQTNHGNPLKTHDNYGGLLNANKLILWTKHNSNIFIILTKTQKSFSNIIKICGSLKCLLKFLIYYYFIRKGYQIFVSEITNYIHLQISIILKTQIT